MKKYISILVTCLFAITFNTMAQDKKMDPAMVNLTEQHCCKKDTAGKACNMADMKNCTHAGMVACCSKDKATHEKACGMNEGSNACCGSDKKEKSKMKDCPMHKG